MDFVPNTDRDRESMLQTIGVKELDDLLEVVPSQVRHPALQLPKPLSEMELAAELRSISERNLDAQHASYFLGAGAYNHYVPAAVSQLLLRSEFYTAYTPYQPEISQGTLQATFEFQSMICALTGMDVANASMYDGATAMAEAALMAISATRRDKVVVSASVHPEYRAVMSTYLHSRGFELVTSTVRLEDGRIVEDGLEGLLDGETACCIVQQPTFFGDVRQLSGLASRIHELGGLFIVSSDPISLGLLKSPGEWDADIAVGEGQGLGMSLSFGGPYLGLLACRDRFIRQLPGRVVGATADAKGRRGFVLTLQTREQHIRREKATSNICTSEALVATGAAIYMALMGPAGLRRVAEMGAEMAHHMARELSRLDGYSLLNGGTFFNEFVLRCPRPVLETNRLLLQRGIVGGYDLGVAYPELQGCMLLCATEANSKEQIDNLVAALASTTAERGGSR